MVSLWRLKMRDNFTSWARLRDFLNLTDDHEASVIVDPAFPLNLPERLAMKIEKGTLNDPILLQFLPTAKENEKFPGFVSQPLEDEAFQLTPRLLQKYDRRVLFVTTAACVMNCRFCFRKNFPYSGKGEDNFEEEFRLLEADPSIDEVILSGGDPLSLSNEKLLEIIARLNKIAHVKRLRLHTRFSIGIPERIDEEFLEVLKIFKGVVYFTVHTNHPKEWDDEVIRAHELLRKSGVVLLSQTVLLRGINDSVRTLETLFRLLINTGVVAYYLHQLDRIEGGAHFEVDRSIGKGIIEELRSRLPGYGVPAYVEEIPHASGKTPIR